MSVGFLGCMDKNPPLKVIFFDMDGVLILSENQHFHAWQVLLTSLQLPIDWMDFKHWIGVSDKVIAKEIIDRFALPTSVDALYHQKKSCFINLIQHGFIKHDGRDEFLAHAHARFRLAIVSSASQIEIQKVLDIENIGHYFEFCIGNEDVESHKPHPAPYLQALQHAKIKPNEALIIEDSHAGISAALSAQIPVIGLRTQAVIPDNIHNQVRFFENFHEIKNWI